VPELDAQQFMIRVDLLSEPGFDPSDLQYSRSFAAKFRFICAHLSKSVANGNVSLAEC